MTLTNVVETHLVAKDQVSPAMLKSLVDVTKVLSRNSIKVLDVVKRIDKRTEGNLVAKDPVSECETIGDETLSPPRAKYDTLLYCNVSFE